MKDQKGIIEATAIDVMKALITNQEKRDMVKGYSRYVLHVCLHNKVILEKNKNETTEMIAVPNKKTFFLSIEHEKCNARLVIRAWEMRHLQATLTGLLI